MPIMTTDDTRTLCLEAHQEIARMANELALLNRNIGHLKWVASCLLCAAEISADKNVLKAAILARRALQNMDDERMALPPPPRRRPTLIVSNEDVS
jgi:hypothetical protein